jgi:drug/metabolite transporter (DMT)-like permease
VPFVRESRSWCCRRVRADTADRLAVVAAVVTILLWASAFVVIRAVGPWFTPGSLAFVRLSVGSVILIAIALCYRRPIPRGRALALVAGYGLLWFAGYTMALNWAEQHLDAGTAALLVNFAPILVAAFAGAFLGEGFPHSLVVGIAIAFVGVAVISVSTAGGATNDRLGVALGLTAAIVYAAGVLMQKVALRSVDAVTATWVACVVGTLATAPFVSTAIDEVRAAPTSAVVGAVFLGVGPTAIAFTTWAFALSRTDAGAMAATTLAIPAVAIAISWLFLSEIPTVPALLGGALALVGVALSRRKVTAPLVATTKVADQTVGDETRAADRRT